MRLTVPLLIVVFACAALGDTVTLQPDGALSNDTHTSQDNPDSPADLSYLCVASPGYTDGAHCMFIEFTELDAYLGATVNEAKLCIFAEHVMSPGTLQIGPCDAAWDEATLTWNTMPGVHASYQFEYVTIYRWQEIDVTGFVQNILDGVYENHGFCLFDNGGVDEMLSTQSGEADDADYRPKLELDYTPSAVEPVSWGAIKALK
jgi:hypothetical protein